ncbi:hypothetical protein ARMGADRAFT_1100959 [Armillaria gallica]|uniref:Uncharacterized protein n=1 Tax=Armillaria gallica TaxID=47427 RepID=A0A2H3DTC7_ARMGA|nr:hypothetical protein ARMGADRAFT_1100959 [Armillaria gallica]
MPEYELKNGAANFYQYYLVKNQTEYRRESNDNENNKGREMEKILELWGPLASRNILLHFVSSSSDLHPKQGLKPIISAKKRFYFAFCNSKVPELPSFSSVCHTEHRPFLKLAILLLPGYPMYHINIFGIKLQSAPCNGAKEHIRAIRYWVIMTGKDLECVECPSEISDDQLSPSISPFL